MSQFGDFDPDDAFDTEPLDPEQTARRVHDLRSFLSELAGEEVAAFDALDHSEQVLAVSLGNRLVMALVMTPSTAPQTFHESVAFFSDQPEWGLLSDEAQAVGISLVDDIFAWAARQGAV